MKTYSIPELKKMSTSRLNSVYKNVTGEFYFNQYEDNVRTDMIIAIMSAQETLPDWNEEHAEIAEKHGFFYTGLMCPFFIAFQISKQLRNNRREASMMRDANLTDCKIRSIRLARQAGLTYKAIAELYEVNMHYAVHIARQDDHSQSYMHVQ